MVHDEDIKNWIDGKTLSINRVGLIAIARHFEVKSYQLNEKVEVLLKVIKEILVKRG